MRYNLRIDHEFESLMPPLSQDELNALEYSLVNEGCRDALIVWDDVIIDGHNRYRLCKKHGLAFRTRKHHFDSRDEAIVWICSNQSGRRNLSVEMRRYLIGKQYIAQRRIGARNPSGNNQYKVVYPQNEDRPTPHCHGVADQLCTEYRISHSTVERCGKYSKALDKIVSVNESLRPCILSGDLRIKHDDLVDLSSLPFQQIDAVFASIPTDIPYRLSGEEILSRLRRTQETLPPSSRIKEKMGTPSIKDMPAYDPDAEISRLFLTIPSWQLSMQRVNDNSKMALVTPSAKRSLRSALESLKHTIEQMLINI